MGGLKGAAAYMMAALPSHPKPAAVFVMDTLDALDASYDEHELSKLMFKLAHCATLEMAEATEMSEMAAEGNNARVQNKEKHRAMACALLAMVAMVAVELPTGENAAGTGKVKEMDEEETQSRKKRKLFS